MKRSAVMILLVLCFFTLKMAPAFADALTVRITQINGSVQVKKGSGAFGAATAGQRVGKGYTVKTAANSSCVLNWSSGHAVKVSAVSIVSVEQAGKSGDMEQSRISVDNGKLYAQVGKLSSKSSEFTIKTPTAIAGVRGSEIMVEATEQTSSFTVLDGSFEVTADSVAYIIDENYQMDVELNVAPTAPEPIPPQELNELLQETREIKIEMDASDVELKDLGTELEKIDEETPLEESGSAETNGDTTEAASEESGGVETNSDPATADEISIEEEFNNIADVVDLQTVTNPLSDSGQNFEPGAGGVDITID